MVGTDPGSQFHATLRRAGHPKRCRQPIQPADHRRSHHLRYFPVPYPVEVVIDPTASNGLDARSSIRLDQICTVDRQRLARRLGVVDFSIITQVDAALKISLGLVRL